MVTAAEFNSNAANVNEDALKVLQKFEALFGYTPIGLLDNGIMTAAAVDIDTLKKLLTLYSRAVASITTEVDKTTGGAH